LKLLDFLVAAKVSPERWKEYQTVFQPKHFLNWFVGWLSKPAIGLFWRLP
jgi:hypothetical protein